MSVLYHNKWHSSDADASKTLIARLEISIVVTAIRVGCKVMRKPRFNLKNLGWDDYLILLALLCNTTTEVLMFWGYSRGGFGIQLKILIKTGHYQAVKDFLHVTWIGTLIDFYTLTLIRLSVLTFYKSFFAMHNSFRLAYRALLVTSILWIIGVTFGMIFQCQPISHYWDPLGHGTCGNFPVFYLITGAIEVVIDAAILALPISPLLNLHLPLRTRLSLVGIFLLGGFVIVTGIMRLRYLYQPHAAQIDIKKGELWISIHITAAFVCASLPLCKSLAVKVVDMGSSVSQYARALRTSFRSNNGSKHGNASLKNGSLQSEELSDLNFARPRTGYKANIESQSKQQDGKDDRIPMVFKVGSEFEVV